MVGMMSSNHQCIVPNWNVRQQQQQRQQEQVVEMEGERVGGGSGGGEERNRSSSHVQSQLLLHPNHHNHQNHHHHHQHHIPPPPSSSSMHFQVQEQVLHLPPAPHQQDMSNYEVAELTWENGQLAMHGLNPTAQEKPTWGRAGDTLESIVHRATCPLPPPPNIVSTGASSAGKWAETPTNVAPNTVRKRLRSDSENCGAPNNNNNIGTSRRTTTILQEERSASASAAFCRENQNDSTMMTWPSFDSSRSLRTKTLDEDSASHGGTENRDDERETKGETGRSSSKRASRAAAVHNQSERRRRDRINQKMKDLQKLVPNASKTDKASMLDEVIDYLKQLQAQVQLMSNARNNMPQMMMPLAMQQQQIQMSLLARMGMGVGLGMGMGMMDMSGMARASPQALPPLVHPAAATNPAFMQMMPPVVPTRPQPQSAPSAATPNNPSPFNDPYCAFLAQSMNMELYNKMAAIYRQQLSQTIEATTRPSSSGHDQRG